MAKEEKIVGPVAYTGSVSGERFPAAFSGRPPPVLHLDGGKTQPEGSAVMQRSVR